MPNHVLPKSDDGDAYSWLHLDDFTPGIYDYFATSVEAIPGIQQNPPAPLGSCYGPATFACIGLPKGGLAALPGPAFSPIPYPYSISNLLYIVGVETNTAYNQNWMMAGAEQLTELIVIAESDPGTGHTVGAFSYIVESTDVNVILDSTSPTTGVFWGSPYPQWTLLGDGAVQDYPVLVFPSIVSSDSQGVAGHMYVYPSLSAPTVYGVDDLIPPSDNGRSGQLVCYDGRILGLATPSFPWPPGNPWTFNPNEFIQYTDPAGMNTYNPDGTDQAILIPENPFGYGAVGSISAGELFLVKKRGGGVLLLGDIDAPSSITYLPGVQPTGNFYGRGDSCQLGFVYCSQGYGAWAWNGSNISQKISTQLEDDFFTPAISVPINSQNYGFFVKRWGDYLLFSNSYLYSMLTQSWWKLAEVTNLVPPFYHYTDALDQHQIYALPLEIPVNDSPFLFCYDTRYPSPTFQWTSTELYTQLAGTTPKDNDRVIDIREVVIRASTGQASNASEITVNILSNDATVATASVTGAQIVDQPNALRFSLGAKGLTNFKIQIQSANGVNGYGPDGFPAPTIWSIDIAYRVRQQLGAQQ